MGAEVKAMRSGFQSSHKKMGGQLRRELAEDKAKMRGEVKTTRNGFQTSHTEMSSALKKDLAEHTQGVRGEVAKMRQEIGASHQDMSTKLRKNLARGEAARKSEAQQLRKNLARGAAARKSEAHVMLNGFQRSHKQMGVQLRKDLASYDRGIESEVSGMRQETIADLKEARTAWQGLASTMKTKRGGAEILPKAEAPIAKKETPRPGSKTAGRGK